MVLGAGRAGAQPAPAARFAADTAALRGAYRLFEDGLRARDLSGALALLAPDFEHRALVPGGAPRVTPRAQFVAAMTAFPAAIDSLYAFSIAVTDVQVRGDSATVRYRERMDARYRPPQPGAPTVRDSSTSYWADRWVRTRAGWRVLRYEEVPAPGGP